MIRFLTAVLLFASFHVVADDLKTFSDGQVINADDFNHNFQKLEQDIADIPAGLQGEQGPAGADGVAAGLNCTTDQSIVYRGDAWVCSSPELVISSFSPSTDTSNPYSTGAVDCPNGKKVTSGGCAFRGLEACHGVKSHPLFDLTGWSCEAERSSSINFDCYTASAYAICQ